MARKQSNQVCLTCIWARWERDLRGNIKNRQGACIVPFASNEIKERCPISIEVRTVRWAIWPDFDERCPLWEPLEG